MLQVTHGPVVRGHEFWKLLVMWSFDIATIDKIICSVFFLSLILLQQQRVLWRSGRAPEQSD